MIQTVSIPNKSDYTHLLYDKYLNIIYIRLNKRQIKKLTQFYLRSQANGFIYLNY